MALSWLLKDRRVATVLIGVSSVEQVLNNLDCLKNTEYSFEELQQTESVLQ
jgi:Predicted oxidoreductases (related to aryl-alcohol dehydrogenases)